MAAGPAAADSAAVGPAPPGSSWDLVLMMSSQGGGCWPGLVCNDSVRRKEFILLLKE